MLDTLNLLATTALSSPIPLGISRCLLGERVRYDGGHKYDSFLVETMGPFVRWIPVCPEVACGLPVPREAMHLVGNPAMPRLVTKRTGIDHTDRMLAWAGITLKALRKENLCGFVFKSKSPSNGMRYLKNYQSEGRVFILKQGLFAALLMRHFPLLPCEEESRLYDPVLRKKFVEAVFVFTRFRDLLARHLTRADSVTFYTQYKHLLLIHYLTLYREKGR
ncbi:hypothetical protein DSUL_160011 [Desulfovibrionales bacterium]